MSQPVSRPGDPSDSAPEDPQETGLYNGFEAYRTATESDYQALLTSGLVVPDTNVFLNLYRYNEQTRNDLFSVLRILGDRLWIPHQVMVEFWRNREAVLQDPRNTAGTVRELSAHCDKALETLRNWANRVGLERERAEGLSEILIDAFDSVAEGVTELADKDAKEFARDTNKDAVLLELDPILRGRVGSPLDRDAYKNALAEAKVRTAEKRPPGYKDAGKGAEASVGDYLVWLQVMLEARAKKSDVLMVTGDVKEDWWRREHGELRGPQPALVEELKAFASVRLFMLRPESLLIQARQILRIRVLDESLQDVERVDRSREQWNANRALNRSPEEMDELHAIQHDWNDILDEIRGKNRVAWVFLTDSFPVDLNESTLTVEFQQENDAKRFSSSDSGPDLAYVLHDKYGIDYDIEVKF